MQITIEQFGRIGGQAFKCESAKTYSFFRWPLVEYVRHARIYAGKQLRVLNHSIIGQKFFAHRTGLGWSTYRRVTMS
ncbi:MAG: hypothetical protein AUI21_04715 [Nitrospirae bacterium 13_1_40CM_2_62_10]|nr:MAG: hypothetical protein AUI21_04715 [Nitrospirae bacterium 13_1_40CM_2_62_10]